MIRGTTPTVVYKFPFATSQFTKFRMYFIQGKDTVLTKTEEDCLFIGKTVSVRLTEEETLLFTAKKRLETKSRFQLADGQVGGTRPKFIEIIDTSNTAEPFVGSETAI